MVELVVYDDCTLSAAADRWEDAHAHMVDFIQRLTEDGTA
ncbi:hypothetical protein ACPOL_6588 [Acidisarcina polymorpha]|uniref:Uncharacterized protein n=1 Tax=Acidisarcina polymorpha TaxID=2211140 RepID=A0A2Z5G941_9BACT|nr:hypothetical protein ACPOL_6588 [Acidisarcina polymorpha]